MTVYQKIYLGNFRKNFLDVHPDDLISKRFGDDLDEILFLPRRLSNSFDNLAAQFSKWVKYCFQGEKHCHTQPVETVVN